MLYDDEIEMDLRRIYCEDVQAIYSRVPSIPEAGRLKTIIWDYALSAIANGCNELAEKGEQLLTAFKNSQRASLGYELKSQVDIAAANLQKILSHSSSALTPSPK